MRLAPNAPICLPTAFSYWWLEPLLKSLAQLPRLGLHEPFRIYRIASKLLREAGDGCVDSLLAQGLQLLQQDARQIQDGRLRQSFLENVPCHRQLHCLARLHAPGPYAGMNITGVTGISAAQKAALRALGAVGEENLTG